MKSRVAKLKRAALAAKIAKEHGHCPTFAEIDDVLKQFPEADVALLQEYGGLSHDEISNKIVKMVEAIEKGKK